MYYLFAHCYLIYNKFTTQKSLSCIEADLIMRSPMRIWINFRCSPTIYILYGWVVCTNIHHFNDCIQLMNNTICILRYTIFFVVKLDLYIWTLLLDHILAWKRLRIRIAYILVFLWGIFLHVGAFSVHMGGLFWVCPFPVQLFLLAPIHQF